MQNSKNEEKRKMKRIFIFGIAGSGKTTLAKKLSEKLKINHYDLDEIYFKKDEFIRRTEKNRKKLISKIVKNKNWIVEGAHTGEWVYPILKKADLVIILKTNIIKCKYRTLARYFKRKFQKYPKKESLSGVLSLIHRFVNKKTFEESIAELKLGIANPKIIYLDEKQIKEFLK